MEECQLLSLILAVCGGTAQSHEAASEICLSLKAEFTLVLLLCLGRISFSWVTITFQTAPILLLFLRTLNLSFAKIFPQMWDVFCWVRSLSREPHCQLSLCWEQMLPQGLWV